MHNEIVRLSKLVIHMDAYTKMSPRTKPQRVIFHATIIHWSFHNERHR